MALAEPAIVWPVKEDACHETADPWSIASAIGITVMDLGSVGWSNASLNNAAGLTGHVVQLVLDAMRGMR